MKRAFWVIILLFVFANVIAAMQAYKFTHYKADGVKTESTHLAFLKKIQLLFTGIDNPRPKNVITPAYRYLTVHIKSNVDIECWCLPANMSKGTVVLFHGYTSCKGKVIDRAEYFVRSGYSCLMVDFMGSGGSGGNCTTVGFKEAEEVKDCFNWLEQNGERNIYLYGSSMGAVAIMKAISDYNIQPRAIIIECPFATMRETIAIRFKNLGIPTLPMADILLFWGGIENGFWGYSHNPVTYAEAIKCPVLLQYGELDDCVARSEIDRIYSRLQCPKQLVTYPEAGHDDYLKKCATTWSANVTGFLDSHNAQGP